jgi:hypothetical protein
MTRAKRVASRHPSQLLRDAAGAPDDERHRRASREIECAAILVYRESIGHKLHDARWCKTAARANTRRSAIALVQATQIFQIE